MGMQAMAKIVTGVVILGTILLIEVVCWLATSYPTGSTFGWTALVGVAGTVIWSRIEE